MRHFYADGRPRFRAGLAQDGVGGEGLIVDFRDQVLFPAIVLLPDLAHLEFAHRHAKTVDTKWASVNKRGKRRVMWQQALSPAGRLFMPFASLVIWPRNLGAFARRAG
jgi:hypothetical protein